MEATTGGTSASEDTTPSEKQGLAGAALPAPREPFHALTASIDLAPGPAASSSARRLVAAVLHDWHLDDDDWHAEVALVVSELVGNAVRHSHTDVRVRLDLDIGDLKITVADGSDLRPLRRDADLLDESGRGIAIIEAISEEWGVDLSEGGKQVWARVRLPQ